MCRPRSGEIGCEHFGVANCILYWLVERNWKKSAVRVYRFASVYNRGQVKWINGTNTDIICHSPNIAAPAPANPAEV